MSLTIVYSTRQPNPTVSDHLRSTCGLEAIEILAYLNTGQRSLSAVYNQGLSEAKYPFVIFVHDDVIFETNEWGKVILHAFQNSDFGILGVAGTTELLASGQWWQNPLMTVGRIKHHTHEQTWTSYYSGDFPRKIIPVVCVDGVFMAVHRDKLRAEFNEQLTGFHFYDIDHCLNNHLAGVKIGVLFDILLIHHSIGSPSASWEQARLQFLTYHQHNLPCTIPGDVMVETVVTSLSRYPKVTVIIPNFSDYPLLLNCLNSFADHCSYPNYEIIIVDTSPANQLSTDLNLLIHRTTLPLRRVELTHDRLSRLNNTSVFQYTETSSELLLFCHQEIELINDALTQLVAVYLQHQADCGTVGGRLHSANNKIQHAGLELKNIDNPSSPIISKGKESYYQFTPGITTATIAGTAAFLLIARSLFLTLGGFNEEVLENRVDIELNLNCLTRQHINYWTGDAVCYYLTTLHTSSKH